MSACATRFARNSAPAGRLVATLAVVAACSGSAGTAPPLPPAPEKGTRATLAGALCSTETCTCRAADGDAGRPEAGAKRFEIRLGPADHELWATVDGMVLYKSNERATDCFYVDLRPGVHDVALRGLNAPGIGFRATIAEQGGDDQRAWWYGTFDFACGAPGRCDRAALDAFEASLAGKHGKLDPCGSTKVKEVGWHTGRMPDHGNLGDLMVTMKLHVYAFSPGHPPGDQACSETQDL